MLVLWQKLLLLESISDQLGPLIKAFLAAWSIVCAADSTVEQRLNAITQLISISLNIKSLIQPVFGDAALMVGGHAIVSGVNEETAVALLDGYGWGPAIDENGNIISEARGEFIKALIKKIAENPQLLTILLTLL